MKLLIDGNAFLNVPTNVVIYLLDKQSHFDSPIVKVDGGSYLKDVTKDYYKNFMMKYLTGIISPLRSFIDEIFIVFDSKSWRKFYIQKKFDAKPDDEGFVYKGNRKMDDRKREMFLYFDFFQNEVIPELIKLSGVHTIQVMGAEGDDLLAALCEFMPNDNIAIWTVDHDITQLVEYDKRFVIVTFPKDKKLEKRRVYVHDSIQNQAMDLMNVDVSNSSLKGVVDYLGRDREFEIIPIDPGEYIFYQILTGQRKDNIPSIYTKKGSTGKNVNITDKKADKIVECLDRTKFNKNFMEYIDDDDKIFKDTLVDAVVTSQKFKSDPAVLGAIREGFETNCKIIRLNTKKFPERLVCMIKHKFDQIQRGSKFDYGEYLRTAYPEQQKNQ